MAWVIAVDLGVESTREVLGDPEHPSRVGVGQGKVRDGFYTFKMFDDDANLCFVGLADQEGIDKDTEEGGLWYALKFGASDVGCTRLDLNEGENNWVSVY